MTRSEWDDTDREPLDPELAGRTFAAEVHVQAAAFYVTLLKNRFFDEATEFAEWYLETFDHDLES